MESNSTLMELNKLSTVELSTALAEEDESQSRIKDILSYRALQCHMLLANYPENGIQNKRTIRYFPILSQYHIKSDTEGSYCPPVFDGWSCWNAAPAGSIAHTPCPYFLTGFDPRSKTILHDHNLNMVLSCIFFVYSTNSTF